MDLHQLEYVVEIAKQNNISKAAEILHVSQPTLSVYLNRLEKQLNIKLFHRHNNVLTITDAGKKYVDTCKKILHLRDELYDDLYSECKDSLHVGLLSSNTTLFSRILIEFQPKHPELIIRPIIDKSDRLYNDVLNGNLDLAFITSYDPDYRHFYPNVNCVEVASYELVIFISKQNPVYKRLHLNQGVLRPEEAHELNSLTISVGNTLPMIKKRIEGEILPELGIQPKMSSAMDNLEFLTTRIYLENMFSIMPFSYVDNQDFAKIMLPNHPKIYKVMISPKSHSSSPLERKFIELVKNAFAQNPYYYYLQ